MKITLLTGQTFDFSKEFTKSLFAELFGKGIFAITLSAGAETEKAVQSVYVEIKVCAVHYFASRLHSHTLRNVNSGVFFVRNDK